MGEMITKPDANPIILAILNGFLGAVGYFLMGQKKKGTISAIVIGVGHIVLGTCTFGLASIAVFAFQIALLLDAYQLGQKLQAGESIGENENGLEFLNARAQLVIGGTQLIIRNLGSRAEIRRRSARKFQRCQPQGRLHIRGCVSGRPRHHALGFAREPTFPQG